MYFVDCCFELHSFECYSSLLSWLIVRDQTSTRCNCTPFKRTQRSQFAGLNRHNEYTVLHTMSFPAFSSPAFSNPAYWCCIFQSRIFRSRIISVPQNICVYCQLLLSCFFSFFFLLPFYCEIKICNRKSYMVYRTVPLSMTLSDL